MNSRILVLGLFALNLSVQGQSSPTLKMDFVIEPYLQQVNNDSFRVLWETASPMRGAVKLGVAEYNVFRPKLDQLFREDETGMYHHVTVTGVKPDEHYFYQAITIGEKGDTLSGPVTPLYIPDYSRMPVSFAVVGDTQGSPGIWGRLSRLIYQEHPSFLVHVGDLVQYGPHKDDWVDEFFKPARNLLRFCPIYPAIGNHEMHNDWFFRYFDLPAPEWFYTLKKGDVLFVFVDTNKDILPGSEQYRKLERILASSPEKWKIMVHHQPVYVSDEVAYGNTWVRRAEHGDPNEMHLKKLYETYGVDLVLNGHAHYYERTWPLMNERIDMENGVTYVTTGGGNGEYSRIAANKSWFDARTRVTNHFLYLSIVDKKLFGQAIDSTGNAFDTWTIEKKLDFTQLNAPYFKVEKQYFLDTTTVTIQNLNTRGSISYQMNDKFQTTKKKEVKLLLKGTTTVSSCILTDQGQKSRVTSKTFVKLPLLPATEHADKGVTATYFEGDWINLPDFDRLKPLQSFKLDSVSMQNIQPRAKEHFAVRFTGSLNVPETDVYRFLLESFDGSKLLIDGHEIIVNDGVHYEINKENFVALAKGMHNFEVQYFHYVRRVTLNIGVQTQNSILTSFNRLVY